MTENQEPCKTPDKCRIQQTGPMTTTLAYYPPVLDGHGHNHNPDLNITHCPRRCLTCGREFT